MNEDFLHYVWKYRQFDALNLKTSDGDPIEISYFGIHNQNDGPDFLSGKVKINDIEWVGNIEIHLKSSDWDKHGHQYDVKYNNVVLHVVGINDKQVYTKDGTLVPTLELENLISSRIKENYQYLQNNSLWIPCEELIEDVRDQFYFFKHRLLVERLERKSNNVLSLIDKYNGNWEKVTLILLGKALGTKVNQDNFEFFLEQLPDQLIDKYFDRKRSLEALFYGVAGMLDLELDDEYYNGLKKEYSFLSVKHQLQIQTVLWNYSKVRPSNFPEVRIAQLVTLLSKKKGVFNQVLMLDNKEKLYDFFDITVDSYWDNRYRFMNVSKKIEPKSFSKKIIELLGINFIALILFSYGKYINDESKIEQAINLLEGLAPEKNNIIDKWDELGIEIQNSTDSQSLLELKNEYCSYKKCLSCVLGHKLLKKSTYVEH